MVVHKASVIATRELAEVEAFHTKVVENRKQFLLSETDRLTAEIARAGKRNWSESTIGKPTFSLC
jgi:uncharacterized protein YydD (DUF2326 family)